MGNGKMGKSGSSGGSQITNAARRQLPGGKSPKKEAGTQLIPNGTILDFIMIFGIGVYESL